jgi:DNA (cytosine-5)-methyltransferase 1
MPRSLRLQPAVPDTAIDLFAGCGGLSLGLHRAGWQGLFAVEKDPMAFETLRANMLAEDGAHPGFPDWPDWLEQRPYQVEELIEDPRMRERLEGLRGKIGLIAGGPPCQGFSVGGSRNGNDARNQMVHRFLEFVELVRSPIVLVENVEGIARRFVSKPGVHDGRSVAEYVVERLSELGYEARYFTVDASDYGVPQRRRRVLIVGVDREALDAPALIEAFPRFLAEAGERMRRSLRLPLRRKVTVLEALEDLAGEEKVDCPDSAGFLSGTYTEEPPGSAYGKLMRRGTRGVAVPDSHRMSKHGDRIRLLYDTAHATQAPGRLPKSFLLEQGTKKDKKVLLDPGAPASTITTHPDEFIHYREARNITVREMARLQSFPDDFTFHGRYTINGPRRRFDVARCSQVGNAVPPLLGQAVGLALAGLAKAPARRDDALAEDAGALDQRVMLAQVA